MAAHWQVCPLPSYAPCRCSDCSAGRNTLQQVGTHFRCGDNAFAKNYNKSDCVVMDGRKWAELRPVTDITRTSPVDLGKCSKTALSKMDKPLLLIASDNMDSAQQMAATANWPDTFIAPTGDSPWSCLVSRPDSDLLQAVILLTMRPRPARMCPCKDGSLCR